MSHNENLKLAQRGAYLSLIVYIILSIVKYVTGFVFNSAAVRADALNNMTDIIVSLAVIIGLKISIKPADRNHPYGHLKSGKYFFIIGVICHYVCRYPSSYSKCTSFVQRR